MSGGARATRDRPYALAALFAAFLAQKAWNLGLERYESTGS